MTDIDKRREQLETRLAELEAKLRGIEQELDQPMPKDDEDRATEREGDEVMESIGRGGLHEIQMIRAALDRIDKGTYGICANCEEPISEERLDLVPHTPLCRNCAR
ncbi:TraR/DksA family transcriptional regulator [Rhodobacteraceae bacterium 2CG4]|uniref:TraR/DksA family transcriptional regulator n=1 Tax=Halovulum marinum TaxID=2662447 RepID=A0A6L5Z078_9RHOB|nr:TraR/DksA family transcriptional regulator [Halovulum marinum]MSU89898.1 TraR/DksA family transcriptional regulator [Halovulum marinum]